MERSVPRTVKYAPAILYSLSAMTSASHLFCREPASTRATASPGQTGSALARVVIGHRRLPDVAEYPARVAQHRARFAIARHIAQAEYPSRDDAVAGGRNDNFAGRNRPQQCPAGSPWPFEAIGIGAEGHQCDLRGRRRRRPMKPPEAR